MEIAKTAPDALNILWERKFFIKDKSQKEIGEELCKQGYNFGDATRKALERAKFLLVKGKRGDKRFIQKHPYIGEMRNAKRKNNKKNS